jgi:hypothetical protein
MPGLVPPWKASGRPGERTVRADRGAVHPDRVGLGVRVDVVRPGAFGSMTIDTRRSAT